MFDKKQCIENIYTLAKAKNIKIGNLEDKAGVSTGYIARLAKDENKSSPAIDTLISFAETLGVSLHDLLDRNYSKLTKDERKILDFVRKVYNLTAEDKLEWKSEGMSRTTYMGEAGYPEYDYPPHYKFNDEFVKDGYSSKFNKEIEAISDDGNTDEGICYKATLPMTKMRICMIPVWSNPGRAVEMYTVDNMVLSPLCSSDFAAEEIKSAMNKLYEIVAGHSSITLSDNVVSGIDNFLNDKEVEYDEDSLPFD